MTQPDPHFEALLLHLKQARGFDFTGYKRSSLMRRVRRRLAEVDLPDLGAYLDYLQVHPDEFTALFNTILINVTSFFRDADAWEHLRGEVLPGLLAGKDQDSPVRVWSAGGASGEEAYSMAMLLAEELGPDEFRRGVKIYATDVDEESLSDARQASYCWSRRRVLTNQRAETLLGVTSMDVGRPFRDLDVSYRPVELRGYIEQAHLDRHLIRVDDVEYVRATGDTQHLEIQVNPLVDDDAGLLGVALVFMDVTAAHQLRRELVHANRQLETAYEELQSTNDELETMNEELQSTNDELKSLNNDLRDRTAELDNANVFLEAILTSVRAGVAVVNRDMHVGVWNRRAEDLWGLRPDEALGRHFLDLDIGLPTDQLRPIIRRVLSGESEAQELRLTAINRRGRTIEVRVVASPLGRGTDGITGAILLMDAHDRRPAGPAQVPAHDDSTAESPQSPQPPRESSP